MVARRIVCGSHTILLAQNGTVAALLLLARRVPLCRVEPFAQAQVRAYVGVTVLWTGTLLTNLEVLRVFSVAAYLLTKYAATAFIALVEAVLGLRGLSAPRLACVLLIVGA